MGDSELAEGECWYVFQCVPNGEARAELNLGRQGHRVFFASRPSQCPARAKNQRRQGSALSWLWIRHIESGETAVAVDQWHVWRFVARDGGRPAEAIARGRC